ncbi:sigma 54-interacting transcriptional regulator [Sodalis ligni]|uniref:sigma 54-interacting transcriptional regulator n=1 Tax=Sodalis ligni TaxID=2697027 RepID=UPI00193F865B|nr:sigma 54-interacting transcriptional regulator [Sodalis ligni]QWA11954.1 sigma 54-interacting transcriptional regulator [Sodalis ligni]
MEKKDYHFLVVSPTNDLTKMVCKIAPEFDCSITLVRGVLDNAAEMARKSLDSHTEIIISRGGTAGYLRNNFNDIPIVSVHTTALNVLRTLLDFNRSAAPGDAAGKIVCFSFGHEIYGLQQVAQAVRCNITNAVFDNFQELENKIILAKEAGAELLLGGQLIPPLAVKYGLRAKVLESEEDSVRIAFNEACNIAGTRRVLTQRNFMLQTILDSVWDGVLVTDTDNHITHMNKRAESIMNVDFSSVLGHKARDVIPNTNVESVLNSKRAEYGELQDIGNATIVTNRVPIIIDSSCRGVVCTFTEAADIKHQEMRLRKPKQTGFAAKYRLEDIVTGHGDMREIIELAAIYAKTDSTVLIQGESGTGKELFAQGIHHASARRDNPFVALNCATIPENLLESELFGYEAGAFTGARSKGKPGLFELADKGTLFLDEMGELPLSFQVKLLRILQEKEVRRVGGDSTLSIDVRIVCATNKNLSQLCASGGFREDLYYRLNILSLDIPPLRARGDDALIIGKRLLARLIHDEQQLAAIYPFMEKTFVTWPWPGNVRELQSVVERIALLFQIKDEKKRRLLLDRLFLRIKSAAPNLIADDGASGDFSLPPLAERDSLPLKTMIKRHEQQIIMSCLAECQGSHSKVAQKLGISTMSLWRKLQEMKYSESDNHPAGEADKE